MLRITLVTQTDNEVVLKVEGWVSGEYVRVLEEEGSRWLERAGYLVLDLGGVRFIDDAGISLLQRWLADRVLLCQVTPFIHTLLEAYGIRLGESARRHDCSQDANGVSDGEDNVVDSAVQFSSQIGREESSLC